MALSKIQAESMNLADTFSFTGTVSGAGGGGLVRLGGASGTGQNVGDVSFDLFTSDYDMYYVSFVISLTGQSKTLLRLRSSSSYLTASSYRQTMTGRKSNGSSHATDFANDDKFILTGTSEGDNAHNSSAGFLYFYKPFVSSKTTQVLAHTFDFDSAIVTANRTGALMYMSTGSHTGFGLLGSAHNIDEYNIQVFGVSQS